MPQTLQLISATGRNWTRRDSISRRAPRATQARRTVDTAHALGLDSILASEFREQDFGD